MSFTVTSFVADSNDDIVSLDWVYTSENGHFCDTHVLETPAGDFSINEVTQPVLKVWLVSQLTSTAADIEAYLVNNKAEEEYENTLSSYEI